MTPTSTGTVETATPTNTPTKVVGLGCIRVEKDSDLHKPLENWPFTLKVKSTGQVIDSGVTDNRGLLIFSNLPPDVYVVEEAKVDGWEPVEPLGYTVEVVIVAGKEDCEPAYFKNRQVEGTATATPTSTGQPTATHTPQPKCSAPWWKFGICFPHIKNDPTSTPGPTFTPTPTTTPVAVCVSRQLSVTYQGITKILNFETVVSTGYETGVIRLDNPVVITTVDGGGVDEIFRSTSSGYERISSKLPLVINTTSKGDTTQKVEPGPRVTFTIAYFDQGVRCVVVVTVQYDPPEPEPVVAATVEFLYVEPWSGLERTLRRVQLFP